MRVDRENRHGEYRDALDERWFALFAEMGVLPVLVPNHLATARHIVSFERLDGVLLTGGNNLAKYGNGYPLRDQVETLLIRWAHESKSPLLGVCRGMQMVQDYCGVVLTPVQGHVSAEAEILIGESVVKLNSYHEFGTATSTESLVVWARAADGVVKAVRHRSANIYGIMWHPERISPFNGGDKNFIADLFQRGRVNTDLERYWE